MNSKNSKQQSDSKVNQMKTFAFWFSLLALIISLVTFWDTIFRSELDILLGKQIRLYVGTTDDNISKTEPIIFMSISCYNSGGKTAVLRDSKLIVKINSTGENISIHEFQAIRELDNIIMADGNFEQFPAVPIVVPGKSATMKQYVYYPSKSMHDIEFPKSFDLEIDLYVIEGKEWQYESTFVVEGIDNVWQDLRIGPPYSTKIYLIRSI